MPPKNKKQDPDNETLTRIAIVSADRCSAPTYTPCMVYQRVGRKSGKCRATGLDNPKSCSFLWSTHLCCSKDLMHSVLWQMQA